MDFPYEIRQVPLGRMVTVPDGENTVSYSVQYETPFAMRPEDHVRNEGTQLPVWSPWGWIISSLAICCRGNDEELLFAMAKESLESLPDLAHKFMLVYNVGGRMFDNCFLVATDDQIWWREYEVVQVPARNNKERNAHQGAGHEGRSQ